jgi:fatty acid-binding protein DegV
MRLNLDSEDVSLLELTIGEVRTFLDNGDHIERIDTMLDEAQARAKQYDTVQYVVIEVKP